MLLERLWASLRFSLHIVAKLLCFCLCLFDATLDLHAMDEKLLIDSIFHWKVKVGIICSKGVFDFDLYLVYVVHAFIM